MDPGLRRYIRVLPSLSNLLEGRGTWAIDAGNISIQFLVSVSICGFTELTIPGCEAFCHFVCFEF